MANTSEEEFYIITTHHEAIWPHGVLLFWAANSSGYSAFLEKAGRYSREQAEKITACPRGYKGERTEFMVPCDVIEADAIRVVDLDLLRKFKAISETFVKHQEAEAEAEAEVKELVTA